MTHLRLFLFSGLLLSLTACGGGTATDDAATTGLDAPAALDATSNGDDAASTSSDDAASTSSDDAASTSSDDAASTSSDDAATQPDAAPEGDAGTIGAGECDPTACTPTCFRAITCVKECGGPATACGCCACAAGSFDAISCGTSM